MTPQSLRRTLGLESALCSVKALLIGLPIGAVASYVVYLMVLLSTGVQYEAPWLAMGICVLGVFAVMWITTWFAARGLRNGSIVDTIRAGDGM